MNALQVKHGNMFTQLQNVLTRKRTRWQSIVFLKSSQGHECHLGKESEFFFLFTQTVFRWDNMLFAKDPRKDIGFSIIFLIGFGIEFSIGVFIRLDC